MRVRAYNIIKDCLVLVLKDLHPPQKHLFFGYMPYKEELCINSYLCYSLFVHELQLNLFLSNHRLNTPKE